MQPCDCVAELIETVGGMFCPTCGRGYGPDTTKIRLKAYPAPGVRLVRVDDDQKPETD